MRTNRILNEKWIKLINLNQNKEKNHRKREKERKPRNKEYVIFVLMAYFVCDCDYHPHRNNIATLWNIHATLHAYILFHTRLLCRNWSFYPIPSCSRYASRTYYNPHAPVMSYLHILSYPILRYPILSHPILMYHSPVDMTYPVPMCWCLSLTVLWWWLE